MLLPQDHSETRPFVNDTALFDIEAIRWRENGVVSWLMVKTQKFNHWSRFDSATHLI